MLVNVDGSLSNPLTQILGSKIKQLYRVQSETFSIGLLIDGCVEQYYSSAHQTVNIDTKVFEKKSFTIQTLWVDASHKTNQLEKLATLKINSAMAEIKSLLPSEYTKL